MKLVMVVSLAVFGTSVAFAETRLAREERLDLATIAQDWVDLGNWCIPRGLGPQARLCAERAASADAAAHGLADLVASVGSCASGALESDSKEWTKRLEVRGKKMAASYDRIVAAGASEVARGTVERLDDYLLLGLELDPEPRRWERIVALAEGVSTADHARAGRLADRALALRPHDRFAKRLETLVDGLAVQSYVLRTASDHPMRYYLSLPPGYERSKGKKWPVLVTLDGSGSLFEEATKGWRDNRGKLDFIIVSPCTFANAGRVAGDESQVAKYRKWYSAEVIAEASRKPLDFDEKGILALIKDLQATHDAESRVYLTGFSAGGRATYMMVWKHPDLLNAAAPVCAVSGHADQGDPLTRLTLEEKNFPVHVITGEKDERGQPGADAAALALTGSGYANVKRTTVPGMGHSPAMVQVMSTFRPYVEGKKKRGDKQE